MGREQVDTGCQHRLDRIRNRAQPHQFLHRRWNRVDQRDRFFMREMDQPQRIGHQDDRSAIGQRHEDFVDG